MTTGMLPEAEFVFLDELFNANSAILNNLLTVLNERVYRRGAEMHRLPLLSLFSASNHLPEDDALRALFDRFLLRCHVDNLPREAMPQLAARPAGPWSSREPLPSVGLGRRPARSWPRQVYHVDLAADRASLRRAGPQGARPGHRAFRPPRGEGAEAGGRVGRAVRPRRGSASPTCGCCATSGTARSRSVPLAALVDGVLNQQEPEDQTTRWRGSPKGRWRGAGPAARRRRGGNAAENAQPGRLAALRKHIGDLADRTAWVGDERSASICSTASPRCCKNCVKGPPPRPKTNPGTITWLKNRHHFGKGTRVRWQISVCRLVILDRSIGECRIILKGVNACFSYPQAQFEVQKRICSFPSHNPI